MAIIAKSAARTAAVLDYFQHHRRPARSVDIARALGLAPSSTSDLLETLVEVGFLDFFPADKTYMPSLRLAFQTHWMSDGQRLASRLETVMDELRQATGASVVLSALRDARLQFLNVLGGEHDPPPEVAGGQYAPVFGTAAGGAMLMVIPDSKITSLVRRVTRLRPGRALASKIRGTLDEASALRRRGFAHVRRSTFLPEVWAVAVPLNVRSTSPLALGVGGPGVLEEAEVADLVKLIACKVDIHLSRAV